MKSRNKAYQCAEHFWIISIRRLKDADEGKHTSSTYEKPLRNLPTLHMSLYDNLILMEYVLRGILN